MLETERDRAISMKFLTRRISAESIGDISQNSFPDTFGDLLEFLYYLNFCVKHKNVFIVEMERDRVISMKLKIHLGNLAFCHKW